MQSLQTSIRSFGARKVSLLFFALFAAALMSGFFVSHANATVANLVVTHPDGTQYWRGTQTITWTASTTATTMKMGYSDNPGVWENDIDSPITISTDSHDWNTTVANDGTYYILLNAIENADKAQSAAFNIDNTPPGSTLATSSNPDPSTGWYNIAHPAPTITLTCTDPTVGGVSSGCLDVQYAWYNASTGALVSATTTAAGSSANITGASVPQGDNNLVYFSEDNAVDKNGAHNIETAKKAEFKVDTVAPTISSYKLNGAAADSYFNPSSTSTIAMLVASEPVTWNTVRIRSVGDPSGTYKDFHPSGTSTATSVTWNGSLSSGTISDGAYELAYTITDIAGNETGPIAGPLTPYQIHVDTVPPTIDNFTSPAADDVFKSTSPGGNTADALTFKASDTGVGPISCSYSIDGAGTTTTACTSGTQVNLAPISGLTDGRHSIVLTVTDAASNHVSSAPVSFVFDNNNTLTVSSDPADGADFSTISTAVSKSTAGDTIKIYPGTGAYQEQLTLNKNLTLTGIAPNASSTTLIMAPASLSTDADGLKNIIDVSGGAHVTIAKLGVEGPGSGACDSIDDGIFVGGSSTLTLTNTAVWNIEDNPLSGCQNGIAVRAGLHGTYTESGTLVASSNDIWNYQKGGIVVDNNSSGTVTGNAVTGVGPTTAIASNGIEFARGSTGSASGNVVSGNYWTGTTGGSNDPTSDTNADGASGIILYQAGSGITLSNNTLTGNQYGIWSVETAGSLTLSGNTITGAADTGSAFVTDIAVYNSQYGDPAVATNATITGNTISNADYGLIDIENTGATPVTVAEHENSVTGIRTYDVYNGSTATIDATDNWWGTAVRATIAPMMKENPGLITFDPYYVSAAKSTLSNVMVNNVYVDGTYTDGGVDGGYYFGYNAFAKVQDGVNALALNNGGTVHVAAGTYNETVTVNRNLTLQGIEHGVAGANNAGTQRSGVESVVTRFNLGGNNITLDGFSLDNSNDIEVNIATSTSAILSGLTIENDVLSDYGSVGMPTENAGNLLIENNFFTLPHGSGEPMQIKANVAGGCNGTTVENNIFKSAGTNGGADANFSCTGSASSGITVTGNTDLGNTGGTSFAAFAGIAGNLLITNNTVTGTNGSSLYFWGGMTGSTTIANNAITSSSGSAVSIHDDLDGVNTGTFTITGNTLTGNGYGIYVASGALTGGAMNASGNTISGNTTDGIDNLDSSVTINAEKNWWGDKTGPHHPTKNPLGVGNAVSDYVDFSPFCTNSSCTTFGSIGPIAHLLLSAVPSSVAIPFSSTIYATTTDVLGYIVVNQTSTQLHFSADHSGSLGNLYVNLGMDGTATTTVSNTLTGVTNVGAEVVGASPAVTATTQVTFTPGDTTPPHITAQSPLAASTSVSINVIPYLDFSETLDATTTTSANIQLRKYSDDSVVPATIALVEGGTRVTITSASPLAYSTEYYFAASSGVTDPSYNGLSPVWDSTNKSSHAFTTESVPPDTTPPVISNIQVTSVGSTTATVNWTTDEGATGQVEYGISSGYGSYSSLVSATSTSHSITLSGLSPSTEYHFRVASLDSSGNAASSTDNVFTTAVDDTTAVLSVTGGGPSLVANANGSVGFATPDDTFDNGWRWLFHITVPTNETEFAMKFSDFTSGTSTIPAASDIRYWTAESSSHSATSTAVTINGANTYPASITLDSDADAGTAGRQVDVYVEVKVPVDTSGGSYSAGYGIKSDPTAF